MYDVVKEYYGKELQSTNDLKTSACCDASLVPAWLKPVLSNIHEEVLSRYYGCGLVCPPLLEGCRVLDLGCGTGRDVYALAQLVGKNGSVVGVDMTDEQLDVATTYQKYHSDEFGFDNVTFIKGYIEKLPELGLEPNSFDVIVSNCVINLSPDKDAVLRGVKSLLKPGGEFYFSDIYADRRLPEHLKEHPVLYGECLGGALYWNDFLRLSRRTGFIDPRLVEDRQLDISDADLRKIVGETKFFSATYRLINIDSLEDACEDHGQAVIYKGTIKDHPDSFDLDGHHHIETGKIFPVCGNTYKMLKDTRMRDHFEFIGGFDRHFGIFDGCGTSLPFAQNATSAQTNAGACC